MPSDSPADLPGDIADEIADDTAEETVEDIAADGASNDDMPLGDLQRWMLAVITEPNGIVPGLRSDAAKRFVDVEEVGLENVVPASNRQSAVERLGVYGHAYFARLLECLRGEFAALTAILGEDTMNGFCVEYLKARPSASYTLGRLGAGFPAFLLEIQPAEDAASATPTWSHLVIDIARLERLYAETFDGPGIEGRGALGPEDLHHVEPEDWPRCRLRPVPCLHLATFDFPVHEYRTAIVQNGEAAPPSPAATWLVVTRRDYVVRRAAVEESEYEMLRALIEGATVGEAVEAFAARSDLPDDELAVEIRDRFARWAAASYFEAVEPPS